MLKAYGAVLILGGIGVIWFGTGAWIGLIGIAMGFAAFFLDVQRAKHDAQCMEE